MLELPSKCQLQNATNKGSFLSSDVYKRKKEGRKLRAGVYGARHRNQVTTRCTKQEIHLTNEQM
jgi:hypothetical protein